MTPQPSSDATSNGTSLLIGTAWRALTTVCSVKAPMLANWSTLRSPWRNGADILPIDWRQCVGWPLSQASHAPQFDSVEITTWSPTATLGDRRADLGDDADALVAEHHRRRERDRAVDHRHVAVAHAGRLDVDPHLVGPEVAHRQVGDDAQAALVEHDPLHSTPPDPVA